MKNSILKQSILSCFVGLSFLSSAQSNGKVWATFQNAQSVPYIKGGQLISDNNGINQLIHDFDLTKVTQAVPSSKREKLQRVFEIECNCDIDALMEK